MTFVDFCTNVSVCTLYLLAYHLLYEMYIFTNPGFANILVEAKLVRAYQHTQDKNQNPRAR